MSKTTGFTFLAVLAAAAIVALSGPIVAGKHEPGFGLKLEAAQRATAPAPARKAEGSAFSYSPEFPINLVSP